MQRGEERPRLLQCHRVIDAADDRHARPLRQQPGTGLVAEQFQVFRVGPDERQSGLGALAREVRPFGEEPVAGMNGIAAGRLCAARSPHRRSNRRSGAAARQSNASSAIRRCRLFASSRRNKSPPSGNPISAAARAMRMAISPRLAISSLVIGHHVSSACRFRIRRFAWCKAHLWPHPRFHGNPDRLTTLEDTLPCHL